MSISVTKTEAVMREELEDYYYKIMEIQGLFCILHKSVSYCNDNDIDVYHLTYLSKIIQNKICGLVNEMDKFLLTLYK